jgi:hypothetical protein
MYLYEIPVEGGSFLYLRTWIFTFDGRVACTHRYSSDFGEKVRK